MAQNGMFRNAFRGFNKQDVLQYIDQITAAWDAERKELEAKVGETVAVAESAQAQAEEAQAQAVAAAEQQQIAETQLAETQQKLYDTTADLTVAANTIEEMAIQLEELQRRLAQLEQELSATTSERDDAIAALADAKAQLAANTVTARQLDESRQQIGRQNEQIATMRQTIDRYENVVGDADHLHQKVEGIVRPYIEQTGRQADETLSGVQATLDALLAQLGDLQNQIDQSRRTLQYQKADSDSRLAGALDEWMSSVQDISGNSRRFFP